MNPRERFLAIFLIVVIGLGAGGFCAYQFVYSPWTKNQEKIVKLRDDVEKLDQDLKAAQYSQFVYESKTKKKSLPANLALAQQEYGQLLDRMLRKAKFTVTGLSPKAPDNKSNVPMVANKKPAYWKLDFDVNVKGDLLSLVEFMHNFYRQPLLHQISYINILKPNSRGNVRDDQELDVQFKIEALVVDQAEDRPTLLATPPPLGLAAGGAAVHGLNMRLVETGRGSPFTTPGVLARSDDTYSKVTAQDEYRRLAGKDIFFGPAPTPKVERVQRIKDVDLAPFLELTRVSHSDGEAIALIFDRYNKEDYEIKQDANGKITVSHYWYNNREENGLVVEIRHAKSTTESTLNIGSEERGNLQSFTVRRIIENGIVLEPFDANHLKLMKGPVPMGLGGTATLALPGQLSVWHVGQMLKSRETGKLMIKALAKGTASRTELIRPLDLTNEASEDDKPEKPAAKPEKPKFPFSRKRPM